MTTLQKKITDKFLEKLTESTDVDSAKIMHLRQLLLNNEKKPKAEDFMKIFSLPVGSDIG